MPYKNIKEEYKELELKQLKSKNNKVMSKYIHLCECNIGRSRQLVTFTVLSMLNKKQQLLKIKKIKNYFTKCLQNLKSDIQYFIAIELGKELNNPHVHFQLFYNPYDEERIKKAFMKTIQKFELDKKRSIQVEETGAVSETTSHNYIVKEFDNKKMTDNEIIAINVARKKLKRGNTKYIQFHSQSRPQNPHPLYKKMYFRYKMNYFQVNELLNKYARRLTKEEFIDNKREYRLPYINFSTGMIEIDTLKLYNLILLTYLYVLLSIKSSVKCIYKNKWCIDRKQKDTLSIKTYRKEELGIKKKILIINSQIYEYI